MASRDAATTTVVLMGPAGAGKSTVGEDLRRLLGWPMAEGDTFHPPANVEKMRSGHALDDEDRRPWLEAIAAWIGDRERAHENALVTCSALKRAYRDRVRRGHTSVWFAQLVAPPAVLESRMEGRHGHYMPPSLLESQLETLEPLEPDEPGAVIEATGAAEAVAERVIARLRAVRGE